jgi:hypothetical protein
VRNSPLYDGADLQSVPILKVNQIDSNFYVLTWKSAPS